MEKPLLTHKERIAYFSMEIGLDEKMPTYAGGLGILAGDYVKSAADLEAPVIAVTILNGRVFSPRGLTPTETRGRRKQSGILQGI